jgi:opacity protein-like surface antigen
MCRYGGPDVPKLRIAPAALLFALVMTTPAWAQSPSADSGKLFVRGYGGATFGGSDTGGPTEHAFVIGGGIGWHLSPHIALIGDAGYISTIASQQANDALNIVAALIMLVSGVEADVKLKSPTFYAMGGGRFTFGGGRFAPFVEGQAGFARSTFSLKITGSDPTIVADANTIFKSTIGKDSATAPAASAGGGVGIGLSRNTAVEAGYRYLRLFGDAKTNIHQVFGGLRFTF